MKRLFTLVFIPILLIAIGCSQAEVKSEQSSEALAPTDLTVVDGNAVNGRSYGWSNSDDANTYANSTSGFAANGNNVVVAGSALPSSATFSAVNGATNIVAKRDEKVIKAGTVQIKVDEINAAYNELYGIAETFTASIARDTRQESPTQITASMTLRIPNSNFEKAVMAVDQMEGEVSTKNINQVDVSEEFTDLRARITTKKEMERRFLNILSKAEKVEDLLNIERQIEGVRSEIERMEGRLNGMKDRIAYSSLTINYFQIKEQPDEEPKVVIAGFGTKLADSFHVGWDTVAEFIFSVVSIWPLLLIAIPLSLLAFRWFKRMIY